MGNGCTLQCTLASLQQTGQCVRVYVYAYVYVFADVNVYAYVQVYVTGSEHTYGVIVYGVSPNAYVGIYTHIHIYSIPHKSCSATW